ncbi:MAG TPA: winged helix-turn-helix domain-containing protein [Acidimicrobiia bacterium]|nr:winged helix-turn-helix domain-containing protein [Acidimicrobiia bacterium]
MSVTEFPKVRDMTGGARRLPIEIDGSSVYEMLITLWLAFDPDEEHNGFELGTEWFDEIVTATPADLREEIEFLSGAGCGGFCALRGLVVASPHPHDITTFLSWLERVEPAILRQGMVTYLCPSVPEPELVDRAARGDTEALEAIFVDKPELVPHLHNVLSLAEGELRERMVRALRRFHVEVYSRYEADFSSSTTRAAAARKALVRGADPERVIEEVTNGLDYRIPPGVSRLVLVPSVVLRPWALIDRYEDVLMVAYPVADEFIDADPDAPPSWVVKLHKALADERRLRILRRLSEGGAGLDDLAEMLGLTKSTVHHHVGLLRAAGLVRVSVDHESGSKTYALRPSVLPEAARTLNDYLKTDTVEEPTGIARS